MKEERGEGQGGREMLKKTDSRFEYTFMTYLDSRIPRWFPPCYHASVDVEYHAARTVRYHVTRDYILFVPSRLRTWRITSITLSEHEHGFVVAPQTQA